MTKDQLLEIAKKLQYRIAQDELSELRKEYHRVEDKKLLGSKE